jgi:hypothetical protein
MVMMVIARGVLPNLILRFQTPFAALHCTDMLQLNFTFAACLSLHLLGGNHQLRADVLVKVLRADDLQLHSSLLQCQVVLVRVLGSLAGSVVANDGVEASNQHQTIHWLANRREY